MHFSHTNKFPPFSCSFRYDLHKCAPPHKKLQNIRREQKIITLIVFYVILNFSRSYNYNVKRAYIHRNAEKKNHKSIWWHCVNWFDSVTCQTKQKDFLISFTSSFSFQDLFTFISFDWSIWLSTKKITSSTCFVAIQHFNHFVLFRLF